jgi:hypothetical protein
MLVAGRPTLMQHHHGERASDPQRVTRPQLVALGILALGATAVVYAWGESGWSWVVILAGMVSGGWILYLDLVLRKKGKATAGLRLPAITAIGALLALELGAVAGWLATLLEVIGLLCVIRIVVAMRHV